MGILSNLLRDLFAPPTPRAPATPTAAEPDDLRSGLISVALSELQLGVARELRELLAEPRYGAPRRLERHGFKVWSQNDEDGILHEIFRRIGTATRSFIEVGVSDGRECNTLKLLVEGWHGVWLESSDEHCANIRGVFGSRIAESQLELLHNRATAENVDGLIAGTRLAAAGDPDLLSIDIDGNDYHVLTAIRCIRPRVLVVEYNGKFPPPMDLVQPYDADLPWDGSDFVGASLQAITNLAVRRGYRLAGTNITGVNAFFVREDLVAGRFADGDAATLFNPARYWLTRGFSSGHPSGVRYGYTSDAAIVKKLRSK